MSIKFLVLGGDILDWVGGGREVPILFYGRGDFSEGRKCLREIPPGLLQHVLTVLVFWCFCPASTLVSEPQIYPLG